MYFDNVIAKNFNSEKDYWELTEKVATDEAEVISDALKIDIEVEQAGIGEVYNLYIPMTQGNREVLKKTLSETGNTIKKETDGRGRINLGTEHADEEKEVIILD